MPSIESSGSRVVETGARIELVQPWRAGQYDPPMQDWLKLPVADSCPADADHQRWGTINPRGYFLVRHCKDCNARFRGAVTTHTIAEVIDALLGRERRFIIEYLDKSETTALPNEEASDVAPR